MRTQIAVVLTLTVFAACGTTDDSSGQPASLDATTTEDTAPGVPDTPGASEDSTDEEDSEADAVPDVLAPDTASPPSFTDYDPSTYASYPSHPEPPTIVRDVALIDDNAEFTQPYIPGHRTTMDGRIALRVQGGPPGGEQLRTMLSFSLFVPEKLDEPVMTGPAGARILGSTTPFDVVFPPALEDGVNRLGHHAICDPTEPFAVAGEKPNPYACGPDNTHDCYDVTVISTTSKGGESGAQLWGVSATVEVAQPKTVNAEIVNVTLDEPVQGPILPYVTEWTEPAVSRDGRLLTGRFGRSPREWEHPQSGELFMRFYDLAYSVLPEGAAPCDVTGWVDFHPMSYAPYDPALIGKYGIAAYPFRDSEGTPIAAGDDLGGTYPWVDREANNVFMAAVQGRIVDQSKTRFPRRCVTEGCESFEENKDWDRGFLVAGSWTHGRLVHVDGLVNNLDWAVGVTPAAHYLVDLYQTADGTPVPVRFGSGRFINSVRYAGGPYPAGYTHNANIMDSLQNLFNYRPALQPLTARDVVWHVSTGVATDEIAFDDMLDPNAFIVSNMQASVTQYYDEVFGMLTSLPVHHNGEVRVNDSLGIPVPESNVLQPDEVTDIHLQNGATSLAWNVPAYGHVAAGVARVEPVALGGMRGRGFWLDGTTAIRYEVPEQPQSIDAVNWYLGVFLDPRAEPGEMRVLMTFPDGSAIHTDGHTRVRYLVHGEPVHEVDLPPSNASGWHHLGLRVTDQHSTLTLLHNGLALDRWSSEQPLFRMTPGTFVVGDDGDSPIGWRGWMDDLVVLAHDVDVEVACNHAMGTLIRLDDVPVLEEQANHHPDWAHQDVANAATDPSGSRYACWTDYSGDFNAHRRNIPEGAESVRSAIHFPEGPIHYGAPRPDSSENEFCLSCHHADGQMGLGLDALTLDPDTPAELDRRRQPNQPPRRVFGNIPPGFIPPGPGPGSPSAHQVAPAAGLVIDEWVLPHAGP